MLKPIAVVLAAAALVSFADAPMVEWPFYGGDPGGAKYSTLTDVNKSNVSRLGVAWEWKTSEKALAEYGTRPGNFQVTPLMIDNVLYFSTPYNRVIALNADTGAELWAYDPKPYAEGQPPNGTGFVHRGVAAWRDRTNGNKLRIFISSRCRLICLDGHQAVEIVRQERPSI
jgi:quinoprotein glucose dehydrogenase